MSLHYKQSVPIISNQVFSTITIENPNKSSLSKYTGTNSLSLYQGFV